MHTNKQIFSLLNISLMKVAEIIRFKIDLHGIYMILTNLGKLRNFSSKILRKNEFRNTLHFGFDICNEQKYKKFFLDPSYYKA